MNFWTIALLLGSIGFLLGAALIGLIWASSRLRHLGKSWVLVLPETQGTEATVLRVRLKDGKTDIPSRNHDAQRGDMDRLLPQGNVAYHAKGAIKGPLHVMTSYGANLIAPTKLQAAEHLEKLAVADWLANYKRQPTQAEAGEKGAFTQHLQSAWTKAKEYATLFLVWDPLAYFKACGENDMQDFLNAQGGVKDPWYAKAALVFGIASVGLIGILLVVVMTKVLPAIQAMSQHGA